MKEPVIILGKQASKVGGDAKGHGFNSDSYNTNVGGQLLDQNIR